jgi:collagenase-like PrtC family protease
MNSGSAPGRLMTAMRLDAGGTHAPQRGAGDRQPGTLLPPGALELLAPARDLECGRAAVNCGADAVYIGADRFGAREAAGNALDTIAALAAHAHQYWARVYVTINTLLHDRDLAVAEHLAWRLWEIGADALIVQDVGLLECDLPPLPLIASTQMHNNTPEKVAFLEQVGFRRAILARELRIDEIRAIRLAAPRIELECFVHGALCVCYSGQCGLSYALGGRSGNRGQCAQPCRKPYRLLDSRDRVLHERSHLLSLRDLNLSDYLPELLEAGVTSFKIEGRLKDMPYVANLVAHYHARLDAVIRAQGLRRSSSGASRPGFTPDPDKTFNRGYTPYLLHGRSDSLAFPATPKMVGEEVGRVKTLSKTGITVTTGLALHPGDGLCFFDARGELRGTQVNAVQGDTIVIQNIDGVRVGTLLHRNHDHAFMAQVKRAKMERRIAVALILRAASDGIALVARDEDGVETAYHTPCIPTPAKDPDGSLSTIRRQLMKMGNSIHTCSEVVVEASPVPFLAVSALNAMRRNVLDALASAREQRRPRLTGGILRNEAPYPEQELSYLGNVLNNKAESFYRRHSVTRIEPAAESGLDMHGRKVMTTRYCIKHQLDLCPEHGAPAEPLYLVDDEGNRLRLHFDCTRCEMDIYLDR